MQQQSRTVVQKWNQNQVHPRVIDAPNLPRDTGVMVNLVARPLLMPLALSCAVEKIMYSRGERVFVLEYYFASK
jgi:hypothetical protein